MKRKLALLLAVLLIAATAPVSVLAQPDAAPPAVMTGDAGVKTAQEGDYTYTVDNGKATITEYGGSAQELTLPSSLGGYPVTAVGEGAFIQCQSLTSVVIPEGMESIGAGAFAECTSLQCVTIPASLTFMGDGAFYLCDAMEQVHIADIASWCAIEFVSIGSNPLSAGTNFDNIYVNGELVHELVIPEGVTEIGKLAFENCRGLTSVTFPETLTVIGPTSFSLCSGLTELTIPDSVTSIGNSAFLNCSSLTEVTLGSSMKTVGDFAFGFCSALESITIPGSLESLGKYAFVYCSALTDIFYYGTEAAWGDVSKGDNWGGQNEESITVHFLLTVALSADPEDGGTVSGEGTFEENDEVTVTAAAADGYVFDCWTAPPSEPAGGIIVPSDGDEIVSEDAEYTFTLTGNTVLTAHFLPEFEYEVENGEAVITGYNGSAQELTLPSTLGGYPVTSVGWASFAFCETLTSVVIPEGVTDIDAFAFYQCENLQSVTLPASLAAVGDQAFISCRAIEQVHISDLASWCGVKFASATSNPLAVGVVFDKLYLNGEQIHELVIPAGVTRIEPFTFSTCKAMTSVTFPESLTSIGNSAFTLCSGLTSVTLPDSLTELGSSVFLGCTSLTEITMGSGLKKIGSFAFSSCKAMTSVTIPASVEEFGGYLFTNCEALTDLYYSGTQAQLDAVDKPTTWTFGIPDDAKLHVLCTVSVAAEPAGCGTVEGGGVVYTLENTVLTAKPAAGYRFVRWTLDGAEVGTDAAYTHYTEGDCTLTAHFEKQTGSPATGDGAQLLLWAAASGASLLGLAAIAAVLIRRKKRA